MVKSSLSRHQASPVWDADKIHEQSRRAYRDSGKRVVMIDVEALANNPKISWAELEIIKLVGELLYGEP